MRTRVKVVVLCLLLAGFAHRAHAYGSEGHRAVGAMADELLQGTPAEARIRALLPEMTLARAATWADEAKGKPNMLTPEMKSFVAANPGHRGYHYTDVPIQEITYQLGKVGTDASDVVQILTQCINVLKGNNTPSSNPHGFSPRIALILLTHLVGDIHQPLHVGAAYLNDKHRFVNPNIVTAGVHTDEGGNFLKFRSHPLHAYWDNDAVRDAMKRAKAGSPEDWASRILQSNPVIPRTSGAAETWPVQWATEMLSIAANAHRNFKVAAPRTVTDNFGTHLQWKVTPPGGYDKLARQTVADRVTTAGFRLAQILQAIFP